MLAIVSGLLGMGLHSVRADTVLRVGHFPNLTHAQALVAHALTRQGKGWFEQRLGPGVTVEWYIYNAGPSAMEALVAKSIDLPMSGPIRRSTFTRNRTEPIRASSAAPQKAARPW